MASVNAPRGLILAKKNGDGSNSTGIRTIDLNPASPKVASALIPTDIFTGDPIFIGDSGSIQPCTAAASTKAAGVFQGYSFVNSSGTVEGKIMSNGNGDLRIGGGSSANDDIIIDNDGLVSFFGNIELNGSGTRQIRFDDGSESEGAIVFDELADGFIFKVGGFSFVVF